MTQLDFTGPIGRVLAEQGMQRAVDHAESERPGWTDNACKRLAIFAAWHGPFRMEQFRKYVEGSLPAPPRHNAWGALAHVATKQGLIRWTGRYESATSPATHGHPVKVWERT